MVMTSPPMVSLSRVKDSAVASWRACGHRGILCHILQAGVYLPGQAEELVLWGFDDCKSFSAHHNHHGAFASLASGISNDREGRVGGLDGVWVTGSPAGVSLCIVA